MLSDSPLKILLTAPADGADTRAEGVVWLIAQLQALGHQVWHLPCIETRKMSFEWPVLNHSDWILLCSQQAVSAFFDHPSHQPDQMLASIACVGPKTAQKLTQYGYTAAFISPEHHGVAAAQGLIERLKPGQVGKIIWPCALESNPEIAPLLLAAGFVFEKLPVYQTCPLAIDLQQCQDKFPDWIVFTSPSAVSVFAASGLWTHWGQTPRILCIGPTTANAAQQILGRMDRVANPHQYAGILQALRYL